jgi:hypothetical protein
MKQYWINLGRLINLLGSWRVISMTVIVLIAFGQFDLKGFHASICVVLFVSAVDYIAKTIRDTKARESK